MVAKGFGKNYFRLTAITATVNAVTLQKEAVRCRYFVMFHKLDKKSEPPPDEPIEEQFIENEREEGSKPCYCNLFFACLAHKVLRLSRIKKPPPCKCRYTKTGIAPPSF
ncbi:hypothetical protein NitYY0826_C1195 [Nitratiruptor sp. YY08-26]|uniref:hypothetical protein n=1 Tax=unclassified Nitratiruptor TaxID=2624044 RepID=UPI001916A3CB|nr:MULTISPECIES: hypothetical protein [unclassified Nitratiruptor]BCD62319.1 hypothetical protein NitYY0813_C1193 [Nitratiruptor sp. YY08-13]BCD66255.1 hypothetical protein NitYY0826_C1195 [Nitratiruptor sp. YY08-26]